MAMQTIIIEQPAKAWQLFKGVLTARGKTQTDVQALPELTSVLPSVVLNAASIQAYAKVCGFTPEQGVPITYPQMLTFPLLMHFFASKHCPWPAMGTVHLANQIDQHEPLFAGDTVRVEMQTGEFRSHEKGQVFNLDMRIFRQEMCVWQASQTLLRRDVSRPVGPLFVSGLNVAWPLSRQTDFSASANMGRRYGRVSGDMNPIHLWAITAKLFGFRKAIAHGLWTQARAVSAMIPSQPLAKAQLQVEFKTPLFLPARVALWTTHAAPGLLAHNAMFEVKNAKGDKAHLRGQLSYSMGSVACANAHA